jgi:hypothetical protein
MIASCRSGYRIGLAIGITLAAAFGATMSPAGAAVFEFSYLSLDPLDPFSGQGEFTTGLPLGSVGASVAYQVTDVSGFATSGDLGSKITGTSLFASADNILFFPGSPTQAFTDINGISFTTESAGDFNIYFNGGGDPLYPGFVGYGRISSSISPPSSQGTQIQLSVSEVSETPLPAALPLFASGLGVMTYFMSRRRRKSMTASSLVAAA